MRKKEVVSVKRYRKRDVRGRNEGRNTARERERELSQLLRSRCPPKLWRSLESPTSSPTKKRRRSLVDRPSLRKVEKISTLEFFSKALKIIFEFWRQKLKLDRKWNPSLRGCASSRGSDSRRCNTIRNLRRFSEGFSVNLFTVFYFFSTCSNFLKICCFNWQSTSVTLLKINQLRAMLSFWLL